MKNERGASHAPQPWNRNVIAAASVITMRGCARPPAALATKNKRKMRVNGPRSGKIPVLGPGALRMPPTNRARPFPRT